MFNRDSNSYFFSTFSKTIQHAAKTTNPVDTAFFSLNSNDKHGTGAAK
jgi:hypothetical protein